MQRKKSSNDLEKNSAFHMELIQLHIKLDEEDSIYDISPKVLDEFYIM